METKFTPGPWGWYGNAGSNRIYLATVHGGRRYVMDFVRWGMQNAQPRFQPGRGEMIDAKDLLQFEVGDHSVVGIDAAKKDTSVYRYDVIGIDCADARLISAAPDMFESLDPEALEAVADEIDCFEHSARAASLRGIAKRQRAAISKATGTP